MSYARIMAEYYTPAAYHWDDAARAGFLSFSAPTGPQHCTLVSYEDPRSVAEKGAYVKREGLGGAIIWTIAQGHLPSAPVGQQDPLLQEAYNSIAR
jgi:chitinase